MSVDTLGSVPLARGSSISLARSLGGAEIQAGGGGGAAPGDGGARSSSAAGSGARGAARVT